MFKIKEYSKVKLKTPILIEGLPGMGNVGKIAIDFMIDTLDAKKILEISSYGFPHAVFVNEDNLVELPTIQIYHKKVKNNDFLLMAGDIQPLDEKGCYEFCDTILDVFEKHKGKEIITLGGVGLQQPPKEPKVYCTSNTKLELNNLKKYGANPNIYGIVGPIVGVSGLLVGLAKERNILASALLAETFGHPAYLGINGAKEILKVISKKYNLSLDLRPLNEKPEENIERIKKVNELNKNLKEQKTKLLNKTDYIG
ncbi:PAC2 family protein [Candidatus Woesearchaeota archaeon]|nr:PAC2 family protein [Candidatus Woesearchaeota archaeon]